MTPQRTPTITAKIAWLISALCSTAAAQAPQAEAARTVNLMPNPSFEEQEDEVARGWHARSWNGRDGADWAIASPGRTGERCARIASTEGADAAWTATVTVRPDAWYRLSGWIKTRDVRGAVGALFNIQNMQSVKTPAVTGSSDWIKVSTVFQAAAPQR